MASVTADAEQAAEGSTRTLVDPRAPRFGQALTTLGLLAGILLGSPPLVYAVAAVLVTAVVSGWRFDLWGALWRHVASRAVEAPSEREAAAPHRFAKSMGAGFTALASALLLAGFPLAGYAVAGVVAALAGLAATLDVCVGCRMYRQVSLFRDLGIV